MRRSWGSIVLACFGWTPKKAASKWLMSFSLPFLFGRPYKPRKQQERRKVVLCTHCRYRKFFHQIIIHKFFRFRKKIRSYSWWGISSINFVVHVEFSKNKYDIHFVKSSIGCLRVLAPREHCLLIKSKYTPSCQLLTNPGVCILSLFFGVIYTRRSYTWSIDNNLAEHIYKR